jgi:transposase
MKPLTISGSNAVVESIQDEIRRSDESRYDHRLHTVLLVAKGWTCPEVALLFNESRHSVVNWVRRFELEGFAGLTDKPHPGRPGRLTDEQIDRIGAVLRSPPSNVGISGGIWDGKSLSAYLSRDFGVVMSVRQCQRLFRQLGFRLRKPRPMLAGADASQQEDFKKTSEPPDRP